MGPKLGFLLLISAVAGATSLVPDALVDTQEPPTQLDWTCAADCHSRRAGEKEPSEKKLTEQKGTSDKEAFSNLVSACLQQFPSQEGLVTGFSKRETFPVKAGKIEDTERASKVLCHMDTNSCSATCAGIDRKTKKSGEVVLKTKTFLTLSESLADLAKKCQTRFPGKSNASLSTEKFFSTNIFSTKEADENGSETTWKMEDPTADQLTFFCHL